MFSINPANCGLRPLQSNQLLTKIVGGVQALSGDWAWQIVMFFDGVFICGGSLINSLWIVTAGKNTNVSIDSFITFSKKN